MMKLFRILAPVVILLQTIIHITPGYAALDCPNEWQYELRPLTIISDVGTLKNIGQVEDKVRNLMLSDYYYINYPRSTYFMKKLPGQTLADYANTELSQKIKNAKSNVVVYERWEKSKNGEKFSQTDREEGGSNYSLALESSIGEDYLMSNFHNSDLGFTVTDQSLMDDGLFPGTDLRLTLEVQIKGCDQPGIFSTNSVKIPNIRERSPMGMEGIAELNKIYDLPEPNFKIKEACDKYVKDFKEKIQETINKIFSIDLYIVKTQLDKINCNSGAAYEVQLRFGNYDLRLVDTKGTGCLVGKLNEPILSTNNCQIGISTELPLYARENGKYIPKALGYFEYLIETFEISKSDAINFSVSLPNELEVGKSYGNIMNDVIIKIDNEQFAFYKLFTNHSGKETKVGTYLEFSPSSTCVVEPNSESDKILQVGILKAIASGDCLMKLVFGGSKSKNPATFSKTYPVVNPKAQPTVSPPLKEVTGMKSTITCVKGKQTKRVTAVSPKCPSGYKKK